MYGYENLFCTKYLIDRILIFLHISPPQKKNKVDCYPNEVNPRNRSGKMKEMQTEFVKFCPPCIKLFF